MKKVINYAGVRDWTLDDQDFMQSAYVDAFDAITKAITGGSTMILHGLARSGSGPYTFTPGAIAHNGEVYQCAGGSVAVANPYLNIVVTNADYDPTPYEDGGTHTTYFDRKIVLEAAAGDTIGQLDSVQVYQESFEDGLNVGTSKLITNIETQSGLTIYSKKASVVVNGNRVVVSGQIGITVTTLENSVSNPNAIGVQLTPSAKFTPVDNGSISNAGSAACFRVSDGLLRPSFSNIEYGKLAFYINYGGAGANIAAGESYVVQFSIVYNRQ